MPRTLLIIIRMIGYETGTIRAIFGSKTGSCGMISLFYLPMFLIFKLEETPELRAIEMIQQTHHSAIYRYLGRF
jgi:hypothetical protein